MIPSRWLRWSRFLLLALIPFSMAVVCRGEPVGSSFALGCLKDLENLGPEELAALFCQAEPGQPLVGRANGKVLHLTDKRGPGLKRKLFNMVWKGKAAREDGYFINRWVGNIHAIDSHYVLGTSWIDGKPAIVVEYPPGTALFANLRDELREVAPGLYLGPLFDRQPCPKLRGWLGVELDKGCCR